jgi:hypothetical protein
MKVAAFYVRPSRLVQIPMAGRRAGDGGAAAGGVLS